ncbi:transcription factor of the MADS box [Dimargaris xerosporica]|nr:transcription factor of the MADS box [Dimargaris xerosporica]
MNHLLPTQNPGDSSPLVSNNGASNPYEATSPRAIKRDHTDEVDDDSEVEASSKNEKRAGRRKIKIEYIDDKSRRHITFSKRKAGIMKKAYELSTLTGTQVLLLVVSETGLVYTFTTPKLQPLVTKPEGKNLIQSCLNAPDPVPANEANSSPLPSQQTPNVNTRQYGAAPSPSMEPTAQDAGAYAEERKPIPQQVQPQPAGYPTQALAGFSAYPQQYSSLPGQIPMANSATGYVNPGAQYPTYGTSSPVTPQPNGPGLGQVSSGQPTNPYGNAPPTGGPVNSSYVPSAGYWPPSPAGHMNPAAAQGSRMPQYSTAADSSQDKK